MIRPWILASVAVGAFIATVGLILGVWWIVFPVGLALGALVPRTWLGVASGALIGLTSWGLILQSDDAQYGLKSTAIAIAAILGAKGAALIPIALTLVVGVLLGVTGAWLGVAIRGVALSRKRSGPVEKLGDQRLEVKDPVLPQG